MGGPLLKQLSLLLPDRFVKQQERTMIWIGKLESLGQVVFKAYFHRNFWFHFLSPFWSLCAQREYRHLRILEDGGVPCTAPLLWGKGRCPTHGRLEVLATREIPGAWSLRDRFLRTGETPTAEMITKASRSVREMHARGIYHGALSWKNMLVSEGADGEVQIHIADLASSLHYSRSILGSRQARFDLLHFCYHLAESKGKEACRQFLEEYGLSRSDI